MAFGDPINEWSASMPAGSGDYVISWKPNFRFPGQYQDDDMGLAYTSSSLFVQNHYREYMPELGRYDRIDPTNNKLNCNNKILPYNYVNEPLLLSDPYGLFTYVNCDNIKIVSMLNQAVNVIQNKLNSIDFTDKCNDDECRKELKKVGISNKAITQDLISKMMNSRIICDSKLGGCGLAPVGGNWMRLSTCALSGDLTGGAECKGGGTTCGCIQSTIFHESLHLFGSSHGGVGNPWINLENKCFGCASKLSD